MGARPANRLVLLVLLLMLWPVPAPVDAASAPRVMLATSYHPGRPVQDFWVSEKLDGVRGRWDGRRLWTRSGQPIAAPAWFTAGWPPQQMDGELWAGRGRFEQASDIVRGAVAGAAAWRTLRFMVFDLPDDPARFEIRVVHVQRLLAASGSPWLRPIPQFRVPDADALDARLAAVVAAGGEGLMLHHRDAHYRSGRSDDLLKYKPYDDAEARVVGYSPGRGKYTGLLGALVVQRADGMRFRLGGGLSDAQRAHPPAIGSMVTYRYNGLTANGHPRFARFLHVRHLLPPPDPP